ncbi:helix-turn-helix domain-containing protein [Lactobacillus helveticus]|uniref:helix-turn-helix domain-containing protein n=1 Tax=Lactobacillus helveticus TaxID=1587 RepID=UPI00283A9C8B|nr:helix-turn-helix transcriptional regulator [Lactobacillus helveticus]
MIIGEALKSVRLHAGISQTEMAAGIVSESFYSKVERGVHAIDAETLIEFCRFIILMLLAFLHKLIISHLLDHFLS